MNGGDDPFASLRRRFIQRCISDAQILSDRTVTKAAKVTLAHRLSGSAGTFGFHELSAAAEEVELAILGGRPEQQCLDLLLSLIGRLQAD